MREVINGERKRKRCSGGETGIKDGRRKKSDKKRK